MMRVSRLEVEDRVRGGCVEAVRSAFCIDQVLRFRSQRLPELFTSLPKASASESVCSDPKDILQKNLEGECAEETGGIQQDAEFGA